MFINLRELYLDNTKIDASTIKEVVNSWNLLNLQLLSLRSCPYITALALYQLHNGVNTPKLSTLFIDNT